MIRAVLKRPKNGKMEPVPALLNSLYGTFGKRTNFGNLWGGGGTPQGSPSQEELLLGKCLTRRNAIELLTRRAAMKPGPSP